MKGKDPFIQKLAIYQTITVVLFNIIIHFTIVRETISFLGEKREGGRQKGEENKQLQLECQSAEDEKR